MNADTHTDRILRTIVVGADAIGGLIAAFGAQDFVVIAQAKTDPSTRKE